MMRNDYYIAIHVRSVTPMPRSQPYYGSLGEPRSKASSSTCRWLSGFVSKVQMSFMQPYFHVRMMGTGGPGQGLGLFPIRQYPLQEPRHDIKDTLAWLRQ